MRLQTYLEVLRGTPLPTRTSCPTEVGLTERFIGCGGVSAKALIAAVLNGERTVSPDGALLFSVTPHYFVCCSPPDSLLSPTAVRLCTGGQAFLPNQTPQRTTCSTL